jgi:hypothetical protein
VADGAAAGPCVGIDGSTAGDAASLGEGSALDEGSTLGLGSAAIAMGTPRVRTRRRMSGSRRNARTNCILRREPCSTSGISRRPWRGLRFAVRASTGDFVKVLQQIHRKMVLKGELDGLVVQ